MANVAELNATLEKYIRPATFPFAAKMLRHGEEIREEIPPHFRRPKVDIGVEVAICQGWDMAWHYGWSLAIKREDISCPLAKAAWEFEPMP